MGKQVAKKPGVGAGSRIAAIVLAASVAACEGKASLEEVPFASYASTPSAGESAYRANLPRARLFSKTMTACSGAAFAAYERHLMSSSSAQFGSPPPSGEALSEKAAECEAGADTQWAGNDPVQCRSLVRRALSEARIVEEAGARVAQQISQNPDRRAEIVSDQGEVLETSLLIQRTYLEAIARGDCLDPGDNLESNDQALAPPTGEVAAAETAFTIPMAGSAERRALMDAMRPDVERAFGAPVEFVVLDLRVSGIHAFAAVKAQRPGGQQIDCGRDGCGVRALLRRGSSGWTAVDVALGSNSLAACADFPPALASNCAQPQRR